MRMPNRASTLQLMAALLLSSNPAATFAGESLTFEPETGVYTVEYYNTYDQATPVLKRAQFELPTRIDPTVKAKVKVKESEQGRILYGYKVRNGKDSKQDLRSIRLDASHAFENGQVTPHGWHGSVHLPQSDVPGFLVSWFQPSQYGTGLKPGQSESGFSLLSQDLPGVGLVRTRGYERRDLGGFSDMGPASDTAIGKEYLDLVKNNDSVKRPAAVPKIPSPQPFDAGAVLTNLQKHVKEDIVAMKLIDPVFAARLDRGFQAAIDAANRGNTSGLKEQIKELRHLLKGFGEPEEEDHRAKEKDEDTPEDQVNTKPWPHPVSKLAARVIDFDLKYIEKRAGE